MTIQESPTSIDPASSSPEGAVSAMLRRELEGIPFSDPRARAFRDFVDLITSGLELEEAENDAKKQLAAALVEERISAKINEDRDYGNALFSLIEKVDGIMGPDYTTNKPMFDGLVKVSFDLYYPEFSKLSLEASDS